MSINKNFVVKNGFEASTNLILANADTRKVGIGTTVPQYTLHVNGGIGATDFYLTGIGTFVDELNVGLGGTVLTVLGLGNSIGIGTALPAYLLDIRSPVSTGQTALYVQGDVRITGDLNLDDVNLDDATIQDLTVTNTFIVVGLSTFNSNVFIDASLNVSGVTTLGGYVDINNSVDISGALNVVGLSTLGGYVDINNSVDVGVDLNVVGLSTLGGYVDINNSVDVGVDLNVVGLSTLGGYVDINNSVDISGNLNVSGIGTITTLNSTSGTITNITGTAGTITTFNSTNGTITNLNSSGISTLGVTTVTNLTVQQVNVSGVTTSNAYLIGATQVISSARQLQNIASLDATTTTTIESAIAIANTSNTFTNLQVTGISTLGITSATNLTTQQLNVSGIATFSGIATHTTSLFGADASFTGVTTSGGINVTTGNDYKINTTSVLTNNTLGSGVVNSSLTSVGTLGQLNVSGVSTLGVTTTTNLTAQQLNVSGNLGVGTINPASNTQVAIAGTLGISEVGGSGARTLFTSLGTGFTLNHNDSSQITFQTLGVNRLTYSHSSNFWNIPSGTPFLIGTGTSTGTANQLLRVEGGAYVSGNLGIGTTVPQYTLHVNGGIGATTLFVSGIVTAIDFNSTSDKNLKYNIETVGNALDTVNSLRGVSFNWKEDDRKSYGVIAQELAEVLPDLVSYGEIKTVNYNGLIGVLIEAVKELKAEVEELKNTK